MTGIIIISILVLFFGLLIYRSKKGSDATKELLTSMGIDESTLIYTGKYICGHVDIDSELLFSKIGAKDGDLIIFSQSSSTKLTEKGKITKSSIKNILIEDASTMQSRVSLGRMLAVGVFAFAMKKTEKTEIVYLVIEWNDGRFDHSTIFEFTGDRPMKYANEARNKLIKEVSR